MDGSPFASAALGGRRCSPSARRFARDPLGGYVGWRRCWRFSCFGKAFNRRGADPLWPSRKHPVERIKIVYTFDLLKERQLRGEVVEAARLLDRFAAEEGRR